jgi:fatty acid desaturase
MRNFWAGSKRDSVNPRKNSERKLRACETVAHDLPRKLTGIKFMLWTIFVILLILWLLGFLGHVGGGLIHLLLVIAVIVLVINLIQGRRPL